MRHTNDIQEEIYTVCVTANICQLVNLSRLDHCVCCVSPFCPLTMSHYTATCHFTVLTVGWLVCLLLPNSTEHNSFTVSSHHRYLSCEPQSRQALSSQPLSLSLSIPNIYYQTTLYNSLHRIIYSKYIQVPSVSCQISRPLLAVLHCWLVCQTLNSVAVCIYVPNAVILSVTLSSPEPMYLKCTPGWPVSCHQTQRNTSSLATSSHHTCLQSHSPSGTS